MPTNLYINNFESSPEQNLLHDLLEESIKYYGLDLQWLPRKLVSEDTLYGEDILSKFDQAHQIEMYIKNVEGFEGEGDFLSRFGLEIRDQITFTISIRRFEALESGFDRPREGDLIWFPLARRRKGQLFEIKFVEHESMFLPLGTLPVYDLRCETFTYSSEQIDTGNYDIDKQETDYSYANTQLASTTDSILDFSDSNPFGTF